MYYFSEVFASEFRENLRCGRYVTNVETFTSELEILKKCFFSTDSGYIVSPSQMTLQTDYMYLFPKRTPCNGINSK